tara:strand:- start:6523 stop:7377 length:855 start_codon:yes stop_codon:yes gene_type:complete
MLNKNNSPLKYGMAQDDEFTNQLNTVNVSENMNNSPMKTKFLETAFGSIFKSASGGLNMGAVGMGVGAAASLGMGIWGAIKGRNAARKAREEEDKARAQMDKLKEAYSNLDTTNPFLNMENTMEDLTINQKQAEFQKQQFEQSQSNIMSGLRGAAGGSGIAALAQSLAQQGQLQSQQAAASIGQQEAANQRLAAQEASRIQGMERQGDVMSRNWEREKVGTLLGMSQQETAAYAQQAAEADAQSWNALATGVGGVTGMITAGMGGGSGKSGLTLSDLSKLLKEQ